jgi:hypothetical protein
MELPPLWKSSKGMNPGMRKKFPMRGRDLDLMPLSAAPGPTGKYTTILEFAQGSRQRLKRLNSLSHVITIRSPLCLKSNPCTDKELKEFIHALEVGVR